MHSPVGAQPMPRQRAWPAVARIIGGGLLVGVAVAGTQSVLHLLRGALPLAAYYLAYLLVSVLVAGGAYRAYVRIVERRSAEELSGAGAAGELAAGVLVGVALVSAAVGLLVILGGYRATGVSAGIALLAALANDGAGAVVEEILLRALVFRIAAGVFGTWPALIVSAVLFGLLHAGQPATIPAALAAGVLLAAAYALTQRVWLAVGIHFGWDFAQDGLFGTADGTTGLLHAARSGPAWLSGGAAGLEGSAPALAVLLVATASLLILARRRAACAGPSRRRGHPATEVSGEPRLLAE